MTTTRQRITVLLATLLLSLCGCSLVPCNHAFPKAEWYWSADAKQCREEKRLEKANEEAFAEKNKAANK